MKARKRFFSTKSLYTLSTTTLVLVSSFIWFSVRASRTWIASGFTDPVGHFGAQDEAVYSRVVLEMISRDNWLTPTFLGRFAYFKPPALYWFSAAAVKLFGASAYSLRIPSLLAGAGTCTVAWSWVRRERGIWPALLTLVLIAADYYWIMMSSVNMTDAPLVFFSIASIWLVSRDPAIENRRTLWVAALCVAAAILTKSAAAMVPALTIALCAKTRRVWMLLALAGLLAAPWFIYTLATHGQWFWREHILTELLGNSIGVTAMATQDSNLSFYLSRLFWGDPVTAWSSTLALLVAWWNRTANKSAIVWVTCSSVALLLFRYHAGPYLLPTVTGLALTAGFAMPSMSSRWQILLVLTTAFAAALVLFAGRSIVWTGTNVPAAYALESYCERGRDNGLLILQPDDEYYSAMLPLKKIAYGIIDHGVPPKRQAMDWRDLGVIVTAGEFGNQITWWPLFGTRLSQMGLQIDPNSWDTRGTAVLINDEAEALDLIRAHPELDFYVPRAFAASGGTHEIAQGHDGWVFLLSKMHAQHPETPRKWSCEAGR